MAEIDGENYYGAEVGEAHFVNLTQPLEIRYLEVLNAAHILATTLRGVTGHGLSESAVAVQVRDAITRNGELSEVNNEARSLYISRGLLELAKIRGINMVLDSVLSRATAQTVRRSIYG